tara:strand:+ start:100 stop:288 length:189 start_codon:yes stop_codon:yes gene_type:complete
MNYKYDIEYKNEYNEIITESFSKLPDARILLNKINKSADAFVMRTWRYLGDKYLGTIPPRIR